MQITRSTDAALRVLMVLAAAQERQATVRELAERLSVPRQQLAKVVQQIAREGWVATSRGRGGGVSITTAGRAVTAGAVLRRLEGEAPVVDCLDPLCPLVTLDCRLRGALAGAQRAFLATLDAQTIADLASSLSPPTGHTG